MLDLLAKHLARRGGIDRRHFLRVGALTVGGAALPALAGAGRAEPSARADAVIQLILAGGPSHLETFDPKPAAPAAYRGPYRTIKTNVPGIDLPELYPLLAKYLDRFVLLRSVAHDSDGHRPALHRTLTGAAPVATESGGPERPAVGAVVARCRGGRRADVPAYVGIPRMPPLAGAAFLGPGCDAFDAGDPNRGEYSARRVSLPLGLDRQRQAEFRRLGIAGPGMPRQDAPMSPAEREAADAAEAVLHVPAARTAFDLEAEKPGLRDRYGRTSLGQGLLLARRLVEAGVPFVTVEDHGWDLHVNLKQGMDRQGPCLDRALAALAGDLAERGLLGRVLLLVHGEFGRSPQVNAGGGRDHWPGVYSVLLGGGGLRTGQVVGASSARGESPHDRPLRPEDVLATVYHVLGIDPRQTVPDAGGRPVPLLAGGTAIREVL
jgi:hypothetical protein